MLVNKLASAIYNDIVGGIQGYVANPNINLEQLEDEVVEERLYIIKKYSMNNQIPKKDLMYSLNCIEIDCKSLDKCCSDNYSKPMAHFEIPQIVNDFGGEAIEFIGSTDKSIEFKVYTGKQYLFHKYKTRRANKPYVYIDTTPNEHNMYDCYLFNAPLLERVTVIAIFKDPRQVEKYSCCGFTEADNFTWLASEIKQSLIQKKINYYRQLYPNVAVNNQVAK